MLRDVPIIAVSATLTPRVRRDIQSKLHFSKGNCIFLDTGNDCTNVSLVVRACEHPMNTFADLDFVIPDQLVSPSDIKKTYLYVDDIATGSQIVDHLTSVLQKQNPSLVSEGLIRPFNATLSHEHREEAMKQFRDRQIRILVCTDAAGMVWSDIINKKRDIQLFRRAVIFLTLK